MKIEVRYFYEGWQEVSREEAYRVIEHLYRTTLCHVGEEKISWLQNNFLRGITVEELLNLKKEE